MNDEKTIQELIEYKFFVPKYQRGYRWQKVNVLDLLNDLKDFIDSDRKTYSLQPLVVTTNDNSYNVIDGQQRLTTISILLRFLDLKSIEIIYESRKYQNNTYIENIQNIDQYHINQAYKTIEKWFSEKESEKSRFKDLLTDKLDDKRIKFIWHCTYDDEIATFIRLNKGKISLSNSELIKALLLKNGNRNISLMQKSIAVEWNNIENSFGDDNFWAFIRPIDDKRETRIDYLFELISDKNLLNYNNKEHISNDTYSIFKYFYKYYKDYEEYALFDIWYQTNRLYNIFRHWYEDVEIYHYVGFMIIQEPKYMSELLDEWNKDISTIDTFKIYLKERINLILNKKSCKNLSNLYRENNRSLCVPLLLLFNIQRIIINNRNMLAKSNVQIFNKFPFYLYKMEKWNVEHIASNTENNLSDIKSQKAWLKTFLLDTSISKEDRNMIIDFLKDSENKKDFEKIKESIDIKIKKELSFNEHLSYDEKNQIWNFCLLDEKTNKSYGNSLFSVKRRMVIGKDMGKKYDIDDENLIEYTTDCNVAYVPIATKEVFLKAYTANETSNREWSRTDAEAYKKEIYDCLKDEFDINL